MDYMGIQARIEQEREAEMQQEKLKQSRKKRTSIFK
jgi:hypothetical protein